MGVQNIRVEPSIVKYGTNVAQVQKITCVADVSSSLNSKYFFLYAADGSKHYIWIDINNTGVDPAPAGFSGTSAEVAAANATNAQVATAIQLAIDGLADFTATVSGAIVTVTDVATGYAPAMHDPATAGTAFAFEVTTLGDTEEELGCLEGDIEIAFTQAKIDVTCHETGATKVASFVGGLEEATVSCAMLETTFAKLKKVLAKTQGSMIPVGAGGTEVLGIGTYLDFKNLFNFATFLNIHPKRLLSSDKSLDISAWKAIPNLEGITLSGEGPVTLPLVFTCYPDTTKSTRANVLVLGDYTQTITGG